MSATAVRRPARRLARPTVIVGLTLATLLGAGCSDNGPERVISETPAPDTAETITLRRGVPHWLDEARSRSLAIMNFRTDPIQVDIGYAVSGDNTVSTLGIDDTIETGDRTWRVVEIVPGEDGSVELAEVV